MQAAESFARRVRRRLLARLLLGLALAIPAATATAGLRGRLVVDVVRDLQSRGIEIVWSSAVLDDRLAVTVEPAAAEPRPLLDEILAPHGLQTAVGPGAILLIVPAARAAPDPPLPLPSPPPPPPMVEPLPVAPSTVGPPGFVAEIDVTPNRHSLAIGAHDSPHELTFDDLDLAPAVGGDVSRAVELLPGIAVRDNSARLHVRGSVATDVAVVLDGLELYDPFHLAGMHAPFSAVDSSMVDRVDLLGGGFTVNLGDRHGGFLDIRTRTPGAVGKGEIELGSVNGRVAYRGPIADGAGELLITARGWYPEALRSSTELGGDNLDPRFGDLYLKAAFTAQRRHRITAHGLVVYDQLAYRETGEKVNEQVDAVTRNGYLWANVLSAWSPDLTSATLVSGGRIERSRVGVAEEPIVTTVDDDRSVGFFGLSHHFRWQASESQVVKLGAELRRLSGTYRYERTRAGDSTSFRLAPVGSSVALFGAHRVELMATLTLELGLRWDAQTYTDDSQVSPRVHAVWRPDRRSEVRVAVGRFAQSQRINELRIEDGETGFDGAEISDQVDVTLRHQFHPGLRVRLDGYDRRLDRLRPRYENLFEPIELFPENAADRVRIAPEEARLRGLELLVQGNPAGSLLWSASYSLASAEDEVEGTRVARSWDQPHAGKFVIGYRARDRWSLALVGSASSGWPTTPITGEVLTATDGSTTYTTRNGPRNSIRLPAYFRLDVKVSREFRLGDGRLWFTAQVANLTDRKNLCCLNDVRFAARSDGGVDATPTYNPWLGIAPSASVRWEF